jgi:hypothetical protein
MRAMRSPLGITAAFVLGLGTQAQATVVPRVDFAELVNSADVIVQARVTGHWSAWDGAHRFIWTHYTLEVSDVLKGTPPTALTLSEPGGTVAGQTMTVEGVTHYASHEEVVVFLKRTPAGYWRPYGWGQGAYTVRTTASGDRRVYTNLGGLVLADRGGATGTQRTAAASRRLNGMTLDGFKSLIRSTLNGAVR